MGFFFFFFFFGLPIISDGGFKLRLFQAFSLRQKSHDNLYGYVYEIYIKT